MKTTYEEIKGHWFVIIEGDNLAEIDAEISRQQAANDGALHFIGPKKVGNQYVAKGRLDRAVL